MAQGSLAAAGALLESRGAAERPHGKRSAGSWEYAAYQDPELESCTEAYRERVTFRTASDPGAVRGAALSRQASGVRPS